MIWPCFVTLFRTNRRFGTAQTPCVQPTTHCLHTRPKTVKRILRSTFSALRYAGAPTERRTWTRSANEQGFAAGVGNCTSDSETTGDAQVKSRFTTRINAFPRVANMDNTDTRKLMANKQSTLVWTSCPSSWETPTSRTHCETKALNDLNRTSN